jgi:hypothetical protein
LKSKKGRKATESFLDDYFSKKRKAKKRERNGKKDICQFNKLKAKKTKRRRKRERERKRKR